MTVFDTPPSLSLFFPPSPSHSFSPVLSLWLPREHVGWLGGFRCVGDHRVGVVHQHHPPPLFGVQIGAHGEWEEQSEECRRNLARRKRWLEGETSFAGEVGKGTQREPRRRRGETREEGGGQVACRRGATPELKERRALTLPSSLTVNTQGSSFAYIPPRAFSHTHTGNGRL